MRAFLGVLAGLLVGASLTFGALAVRAISEQQQGQCEFVEPDQWLMKGELPWDMATESAAGITMEFWGGRFQVTDVGPGECGEIAIKGNWTTARGWSFPNVGASFAFSGSDGAGSFQLNRIWFGELPLSLDSLPASWRIAVGEAISEPIKQRVAFFLRGENLSACGFYAGEGGLTLFICESD